MLLAHVATVLLSAQAGGPELRTDHPYYPGEGALSTPARAVQRAMATSRGTLGSSNDRDRLIRLFLWRAETFAHNYSPAVHNLPGVKPDPHSDNPLMIDYDAMRALFSYGWGLCGTNHAHMRVFADEMGWNSRRRALSGDTGYEIHVDGGWRYVNTDQYTLHFLSDSPSAHFASLDQVIGTNHHYAEWNPDLGLGYRLPQANTHGNYQDFAGVTGTVANRALQWRSYYNSVWKPITGGNYSLYGEGYTAAPVVYRLRRGETFTRWIHPDGAVNALGLAGRAWWGFNAGNMGGGDNSPYTQWSFVQNAPARDETPGGAEESRGQQRYGNGAFDWTPNLASGEHLDGTLSSTGTLVLGGAPALKATAPSTLVLFHYAPYTIAARPSDGADPANAASDGAVVYADATGSVAVEVSTNAGATWTSAGALSGPGASLDFTETVKGRNQYLLRLSFDASEGLGSLRLRTLTMLNPGVYPTLKSGGSSVTYAASNVGGLDLSPDLWNAATANSGSGYVVKTADSGNLDAKHYAGSNVAYQSTNNQPISTTWKLTLPPQLAASGAAFKQILAGANYTVRVPPSNTPYGRIEISSDQSTWTKIAEYFPPSDNSFSSYWTYGRSQDASSLGGTTWYVRFTTYNGGYTSGIRYLRLYATYSAPASAVPVEVAYHWNEATAKSHAHTVPAGSASQTWTVPTGAVTAQDRVVLRIASQAPASTPPSITTPPSNQTVTEGQTATFSVVASGSPTLAYQWTKNGTAIPNATGASYTTPPTSLGDHGSTYAVTVSNAFGNATSSAAVLTVDPAPAGGAPVTLALQEGVDFYFGTEDTYLDEFAPTGNHGGLDRMDVRRYDPGTGLTEHQIVLLRFDLSAVPATATVTSATLTLHNTRAASNSASDVVALEKVLSAWTEGHTWSAGVPSVAASGVACPHPGGYTSAPTPPEPYVITGMDALVQDWVANPAANRGLMLSSGTNLNLRFATSEYADWRYRPKLEITYTTAAPPPPPGPSPAPAPSPSPAAGGGDRDNGESGLDGCAARAGGPSAWAGLLALGLLALRRVSGARG